MNKIISQSSADESNASNEHFKKLTLLRFLFSFQPAKKTPQRKKGRPAAKPVKKSRKKAMSESEGSEEEEEEEEEKSDSEEEAAKKSDDDPVSQKLCHQLPQPESKSRGHLIALQSVSSQPVISTL